MTSLLYILLIVLGSLVLVKAVSIFIKSSSKLAGKLGISEYTISFLLVAIATSLPETVVGINSAIEGTPILSFGNAIGSNIALLTLVVGLPVLLGVNLSTRSILNSKDAYFSLFFSTLPIALVIDGTLSSRDGIILLCAYLLYFFIVWRRSSPIEQIKQRFETVNMWREGLLFFLSLGFLLGASELIVKSAESLSLSMGWGLAFVGMTVTAIGTSLPEIAFSVTAIRSRHHQEILGDVIGSIVANSTLVLGITSLIHPITINHGGVGYTPIIFLIFIMLVFLRLSRTKEKLDKLEAGFLIILYLLFIATEYYVQGPGAEFFTF